MKIKTKNAENKNKIKTDRQDESLGSDSRLMYPLMISALLHFLRDYLSYSSRPLF